MDREPWWATVQRVPKSQTWLRTHALCTPNKYLRNFLKFPKPFHGNKFLTPVYLINSNFSYSKELQSKWEAIKRNETWKLRQKSLKSSNKRAVTS